MTLLFQCRVITISASFLTTYGNRLISHLTTKAFIFLATAMNFCLAIIIEMT